jgi:hypothetical protein
LIMAQPKPFFFVSYAHSDQEIVYRVIDDLNQAGIQVWSYRDLHAGDSWQEAITSALKAAAGMIVFLSSASMQSSWVMRELTAFASGKSLPIIPVMLEHVSELPPEIMHIQYLDLTDPRGYQGAIERLILSLKQWEQITQLTTDELNVEEIARDTAREAQDIRKQTEKSETPPDSIFIVHGHDHEFLKEVKQFLVSSGITPIVLSEEDNQHQSLFEKFWKYSVTFVQPERGSLREAQNGHF